MNKTIEIVVSPNGDTRVETKGFAGAECQQASRFLEEALGSRRAEQLTSDFYLTSTEQQKLREGA